MLTTETFQLINSDIIAWKNQMFLIAEEWLYGAMDVGKSK